MRVWKKIGRCLIVLWMAAMLAAGSVSPVWAAPDAQALSAQIIRLQTQIDAQAKRLDTLKAQMAAKNAELTKLEQALAQARQGMSERVRVFYMFGSDGVLQYLFTSDNISEFLAKADQVRTVMRADNVRVASVARLQRRAAQEKVALAKEQKEAEQSRQKLNAQLKTVQQKLAAYEKTPAAKKANSGVVSTSGFNATTGHRTETSNQMDFICAVVAQECNSDYQGSLAVISCVMNRGDTGRWGGRNCVAVLKSPGQFEAYLSGAYKKYLNGRYPAHVKQAVEDCMLKGIRNHSYQSFHAGSSPPSFGGNHYY